MQVPLLDLKGQFAGLRDEILREMTEVCDSQMFILGKKVETLEKEINQYCGTNYSCGVSSGSDALIIAMMVEGIGAGDEVITSPFTFFATVGAIARIGATPVFADIDQETFNLDPVKLEEKITPRTKAVIPVHLFGQCADMDKINAIAKKHNLIVIEDACQAIGAEYKGKRAGSMSEYGCFSFFPSKNLGCFGDAGIVTTDTAERYDKLRIFRNHGQGSTYIHKYIGGNFRIDALQAAILSIKLRELDKWSEGRQRNAAIYAKLFAASKLAGKIIPPVNANYPVRHIYNQYCILVKSGRRDELKQYLQSNGVGCNVYYPLCLHQQECFAYLGGKAGDFPVSERTAGEILALPIYPELQREQLEYVVATIEKGLC